jgi:hypothetical protein
VRDKPCSQDTVPKPRGGIHVVGDESEVVDAPPGRPLNLGHGRKYKSTWVLDDQHSHAQPRWQPVRKPVITCLAGNRG